MRNAIVTRQDGLPAPEDWQTMLQMGNELVKSGLMPPSIKTAQAAVVIIQKGRELGIPPMAAINGIAIIGGKPVAGAELMLALLYRDHGDHAVRVIRSDAERCDVEYRRRTWTKPERFSFSIEDAKRADLSSGNTWQKYPQAMLRARCISAVARMAFPDSIGGMYLPEELGAAVTVIDDGEVVFAAPGHDDQDTPPPPTVIEHQPQQPAKQREAQAHETAMKRLHAIGRDAGFDHDDLHKIMTGRFDIASLKDASVQMLDDMATLLDGPGGADMYAAIHPAATTRALNPEEELIGKISAAETQPELQAIRKEAAQNGMLSEAVKAAGNARRTELNRQERGELGGMPPDVSRYANA